MIKEKELSNDNYQNAVIELSFLLKIFSLAIKDVMGDAVNIIGVASGREAALKMPLNINETDLTICINKINDYYEGSFDISSIISDTNIELSFKKCALKNVCLQNNNENPDNNLCQLFHAYLNGIMMKFSHRRLKMLSWKLGNVCIANHVIVA